LEFVWDFLFLISYFEFCRMLTTLTYNALMAIVVAGALFSLGRVRTTWAWGKACLDVALAAVALAVLVALPAGERFFGVCRLACYGLFLDGAVVLVGSALLLRSERPKTAAVSAILALSGAAVAVDAFLIEPSWLQVARVEIATPKITRPVRIVVLADIQTDAVGPYEREVLHRALLEEPDLILLAGDYVQADYPEDEQVRTDLNGLFRQLDVAAPLGVFAVRGNVDDDGWADAFAGLPITTVERRQAFDVGQVRLTCLAERESFRPWTEVPGGDPGRFHLVLGHSPNFALGKVDADLLIAGHTHGGQVRLPLFGPVLTQCELPNRYASGLLDLSGGGRLYVPRGIGMERGFAPRLRFNCRPELTVIELVPR
jgi:hypothetical protein